MFFLSLESLTSIGAKYTLNILSCFLLCLAIHTETQDSVVPVSPDGAEEGLSYHI